MWRVNSNLSQPILSDDDPASDPYDLAITGTPYTSIGGEVTFTIEAGTVPFEEGDSFTFTTGGGGVEMRIEKCNGTISEVHFIR